MSPAAKPGGEARLAIGAGVLAYVIWGLVPLLLQMVGRQGLNSLEILAQRTIWAVPAALVFVLLARQGRQALSILRRPPVLAWLTLSAGLIAVNWGVFIWAINVGRVLETSLGYYINPLFNMAAGALIFGERVDRVGWAAIGLAAAGVAVQTAALGHLPLVSLVLALSFCGYGVVRKRVAADAQAGLLVECAVLAIPALLYVAWLARAGEARGTQDATTLMLVIASGALTAFPLVLFAWSARRSPLSVLAFLQFIAPSMTFVIGVAQGEPLSALRAASFALIWAGVAVFTWGAWRRSRMVARAVAEVQSAP